VPKSVFLSHSSEDNTFCDCLARDLVDYDVEVWYDEWEIKVGDSLRNKIAAGIETNDYLAVVLSKASVQSQWVQQELNAALDKELKQRQVFVLPLLIEDCNIPTFLRDKKWADFRVDYRHGLKQLLNRLAAKKRRRRRPKSALTAPSHRNDELALALEDFEEWFLDRLQEGNDIVLQRHFWNWRDALNSVAPKVSPDDIPAKQIDFDETGQAILDRLTTAVNVLVRYDHARWFNRAVQLLYDAFILVNRWGTEEGASADANIRPAAARCRVLDGVFVVGAAAMEEKRYPLLPLLLDRTTADRGYWERRGWFRFTLTMAARGEPQTRANWYLPIPRAVDYLGSHPVVRRYFGADEAITNHLCQFDLLQCLYWDLRGGDRVLPKSFPTCAQYASRRVEPLVKALIAREEPSGILGDFSDDRLASLLKAYTDIVRERMAFGYAGWADEGWDDPVIQQFLATHGTQQ
jgi:hypothetical protein